MPLTEEKKKAWDSVHKAYSMEVANALPKKFVVKRPVRMAEVNPPKKFVVKRPTAPAGLSDALISDVKKSFNNNAKVFQVDSGGEDSERSYRIDFPESDFEGKGYSNDQIESACFKLIPEHHTFSKEDGIYSYEFMADIKDVNKYLQQYGII